VAAPGSGYHASPMRLDGQRDQAIGLTRAKLNSASQAAVTICSELADSTPELAETPHYAVLVESSANPSRTGNR